VNAVTTLTGTTVAGGNGQGSNANQLNVPYGVFVDTNLNVYVSDHGNNRVMKWTPGATSGIAVAGNNGWGQASNQLSQPSGVWVDLSGNVYVADYNGFRIQKWGPGASSGTTVAGNGGAGAALNYIYNPYGVYVDASGNIYTCDVGNQRVVKWAPGATYGTLVAGGNGAGSNANQLNSPQGLYVDAAGNVYIADINNNRIQKWAPGATSGTTVAGNGTSGTAANQLWTPTGVFVDSSGNIFVSDFQNSRIQKWAPGATTGITVGGDSTGNPGSSSTLLHYPTGVFVDKYGSVYACDQDNSRVQKFSYSSSIVNTFQPVVAGVYTATITFFNNQSITIGPITIGTSPIINYGNNPFACYGASFANLPYTSVLNNPSYYNVTYNSAAISAGFTNISNGTFTSSPISLPLPTNVSSGTYFGSIILATVGGCVSSSYNFAITVNPVSTASLTISSSLGNTICTGSHVLFTANPINGGANPGYQWQLNGSTVGNNTDTFSINNLVNGDIVSCILTSTAPCVPVPSVSSNSINFSVTPAPSVNSVSNQTVCSGSSTASITFSGSTVAGTNYNWSNTNPGIGVSGSTGTGTIASFLATNTSSAPIIDTFTVTPVAGLCVGATTNFAITVNPLPSLSSSATPNDLCSGALFTYTSASATPGTSFAWSRPAISGISNPASHGLGNPSEILYNSSGAPVLVTYFDTLSAFGCINVQTITFMLNPTPSAPTMDIKPNASSSTQICSTSTPLDFGSSNAAPSGSSYIWSVNNAIIYSYGSGNQNCLVSFPYTGTSYVTLTTRNNLTYCTSSVSDTLFVANVFSSNDTVIYYNSEFVCLNNIVNSYQWGYDAKNTLSSLSFPGEINQNYYNPNPDLLNYYYWVIISHAGCSQKIYYNAPPITGIVNINEPNAHLQVFPNPASDRTTVELLSAGNAIADLQLCDMTGRVLSHYILDKRAEIDLSSYPSGIYMLVAYKDGIVINAAKLMKN
jgi:sugar lactone lactonase YvrE